jgi:hypothetical protein
MSFNRRVGINVITGLIQFNLNAGLMEPRRGLTLIAAKEKLGRESILSP